MPTLTHSNPKYRKHRASGQAVVTLCGVDHYLGPYGTKASRLEYDRLTSAWLANGRKLSTPGSDITIVEVLAAFRRPAVSSHRLRAHVAVEEAVQVAPVSIPAASPVAPRRSSGGPVSGRQLLTAGVRMGAETAAALLAPRLGGSIGGPRNKMLALQSRPQRRCGTHVQSLKAARTPLPA